MSVMALDPGNSTGWVLRTDAGKLLGGTIGEDHEKVADKIIQLRPDVVVYETFQLYPGKAQKMMWSTFYPCEVIGVIRYVCAHIQIKQILGVQPSVKKFALSPSEESLWKTVEAYAGEKITEHTRDAVRLLRYYERNLAGRS